VNPIVFYVARSITTGSAAGVARPECSLLVVVSSD